MSLSAEGIAQTAEAAFEASQLVSPAERTRALLEIRKELEANRDAILRANSEDVAVRSHLFLLKLRARDRAADRCSRAARRGRGSRGVSRVSARETARPSHGREMGHDAARRDGHRLAPGSHGHHHLRARTTRQPRPLPRLMSDRRAPRHLRGASRSYRQHRRARAQIRCENIPSLSSLYHYTPTRVMMIIAHPRNARTRRQRRHPERRQRVRAHSSRASAHDPSRPRAHRAPGGVHTDRRDARGSDGAALAGPVHRSGHTAREQCAGA